MDSNLIQNFDLYTPRFLHELIKNVKPSYRINNIIPFSFDISSSSVTQDSPNPVSNNGIVSWYYGWFNINQKQEGVTPIVQLWGVDDTIIYGGSPTAGNQWYHYSFFGLATRWRVAGPFALTGFSFTGWKVDMYQTLTLSAGFAVNFVANLSTRSGAFLEEDNLVPNQPYFSKTVSQVVNPSVVNTQTGQFRLPYYGATLFTDNYSLAVSGGAAVLSYSVTLVGSYYEVEYTLTGITAITTVTVTEKGVSTLLQWAVDTASICAAVPAAYFLPYAYIQGGSAFYVGMPFSTVINFGSGSAIGGYLHDPISGAIWEVTAGNVLNPLLSNTGLIC